MVNRGAEQNELIRLVWHPSFASGNAELDAEHRELFDEINALWTLIVAERPIDEICATIDALYGKMLRHFHDEERLLQRIGYPELAAHVRMHAALTARADAVIEDFRRDRADFGPLFTFLAHDMVARHIVNQDRAYFPYLEAASQPDGTASAPAALTDDTA
ncbi:hemerythrin family protein [Azoarcus sp. DN11]|uniref:bacteriohemerythrin n=1 Tax=Azoarcus sp. DN11 TaxID=356837 RepID=UPI0013E3A096|nr:hemerythrin family protein [Azoarcus sp. DN11]